MKTNVGQWIAITVVLALVLALLGGFVLLYKTQAFWGLEDNSNACTLNTTFNNTPNLIPVLVISVVGLVILLFMSTARAF